MRRPIITLTTDFGGAGSYVGQMKGVILARASDVTIVDIAHDIPPQNVMRGAQILDEATGWFPQGSIHVAVVDPGVGTDRRILCAEVDGRFYIAPDNGLLSILVARRGWSSMHEVADPSHQLKPVSTTFHGRDVMAPAAAHLATGGLPADFGPACDDIVRLATHEVRREPGRIVGEVTFVDSFGNAVTNIRADDLPLRTNALLQPAVACPSSPLRIACRGINDWRFTRTYGEASAGDRVALIGSSGLLELAVVCGSASRETGVDAGDEVVVRWAGVEADVPSNRT